jgi:hypothetical protein
MTPKPPRARHKNQDKGWSFAGQRPPKRKPQSMDKFRAAFRAFAKRSGMTLETWSRSRGIGGDEG